MKAMQTKEQIGHGVATKVREKRTNRTELSKKPTGETALAPVIHRPVTMLGAEDKDSRPQVHRLVQGTTKSDYPVGSLINNITGEALIVAEVPFRPYQLPRFLILDLRSSYRAWGDTAGPPLYSDKPLAWVEQNHPEHLEDCSDSQGEGPRAVRVVSLIGLLQDHQEPILIEFSKSAVRAAVILSKLEKARERRGLNAGWYLLGVEPKTWQQYSWFGWTKPSVEDPPESELQRALPWLDYIQQIASREDRIEPGAGDPLADVQEVAADEPPF